MNERDWNQEQRKLLKRLSKAHEVIELMIQAVEAGHGRESRAENRALRRSLRTVEALVPPWQMAQKPRRLDGSTS